ncbi:MAG: hypothetical protein JJU20_03415, partial [Opitutales bacterium]|nr:hypothetical protein [Opitutales bacterium]
MLSASVMDGELWAEPHEEIPAVWEVLMVDGGNESVAAEGSSLAFTDDDIDASTLEELIYSGEETPSQSTLQEGVEGEAEGTPEGATESAILTLKANNAEVSTEESSVSYSSPESDSADTIFISNTASTVMAERLKLTLHSAQGPPSDELSYSISSGETLSGTGTVKGSLTNQGILAPGNSPGIITVDGNLDNSSGTITIEIGGANPGTQHDKVQVTGTAQLGGLLEVQLIDGFVPSVGDSFTVLTADSIEGRFDSAEGLLSISADLYFEIEQSDSAITLTVKRVLGGIANLYAQTEADAHVLGEWLNSHYFEKEVYAANATFDLFGFVQLQGSFSFEAVKAEVNILTGLNADHLDANPDLRTSLELIEGFDEESGRIEDLSVLISAVAVANGEVFVGPGSYFEDTNGDGFIDASDSVDDSALGFSFSGIDFALAFVFADSEADPDGVVPAMTAMKASIDNFFNIDWGFFEFNIGKAGVVMNSGSAWAGLEGVNPVVDFAGSFESGAYEIQTPGSPILIDFHTDLVGLQMQDALLRVSDFVSVSGDFYFLRLGKETVTLVDGESEEVTASFIGADNLNVFVGAGPYFIDGQDTPDENAIGFAMQNVAVAIGLFSPTIKNGKSYYAVKIDADSAGLVGLGLDGDGAAALSASGYRIEVNSGSDQNDPDAQPAIDFSASPAGEMAVPVGDGGLNFDFSTSTMQLSIAQALFSIENFIHISGSFAMTKVAAFEVTLNDDDQTEREVSGLALAGGSINVFVGYGNYFIDSNGDGVIDENDIRDPDAIGMAVDNVSFAYLSMRPTDEALKNIRYSSLKISADEIGFVGIDALDLSASGAVVEMNRVSNPTDADDRAVVDFSQMDDGFYGVNTGSSVVEMDFDSNRIGMNIANGLLRISDFIFVQGSFSYLKHDGLTASLTTGEEKELSVASIAAGGVRIFVGDGPYFVDSNGDGVIDENDTPSEDAFGLVFDDINFALSLFRPTDSTDRGSYYALSAFAQEVKLTGLEEIDSPIKLSASGYRIEVNAGSEGKTTGAGGSTSPPRPAVDFSSLEEGFYSVDLGNGRTIDFDFVSRLTRVSIDDALFSIANFVYFSGGMSFTYIDEFQAPISDGSTMTSKAYGFSGHSLDVFVGYGNYFEDSNGDGVIDARDARNQDALGIAMEGATFGLMVTKPKDFKKVTYTTAVAEATRAGVVGLDFMDLEVRDMSIGVNLVSNKDNKQDQRVIDFSAFPDGSFDFGSPSGSVTFDFSQQQLYARAGYALMRVSDFLLVEGGFSFEKGATVEAVLENGLPIPVNPIDIGIENGRAFFGMHGPYRSDTNGDGVVTDADEINEDAIGFNATNVNLAMTWMKPVDETLKINYVGLKASADEVGFVGTDILNVNIPNIVIELNLASGGSQGSENPVIDFSQFEDGFYGVKTGSEVAELDFDNRIIRASTDLAKLSISEFLVVEASMNFEMGEIEEVTINTGLSGNIGQIAEPLLGDVRELLNDLSGELENIETQVIGLLTDTLDTVKASIEFIREDLIDLILDNMDAAVDEIENLIVDMVRSRLLGLVDSSVLDPLIDSLIGGVTDPFPTPINTIVENLINPFGNILKDGFSRIQEESVNMAVDLIVSSLQPVIRIAMDSAGQELEARREKIENTLNPTLTTIELKIDQQTTSLAIKFSPYLQKLESLTGMTIGENFATVSGLETRAVKFGLGSGKIFAGIVVGGSYDFDTPLSEQDNVIGFSVQGVNMGLAYFTPTLTEKIKPFVSAKITAQSGEFGGGAIPEGFLELIASDLEIRINTGGQLIKGVTGFSSINFADFIEPDTDLNGNGVIDAGYRIETDTSGFNPVTLDYEDYLVGVRLGHASLKLLNFVYLNGSFEFQWGTTETVTVSSGLPGNITSILSQTPLLEEALGLLGDATGVEVAPDLNSISGLEVSVMTVAASNLSGFIGIGEPDFTEDLSQQGLTGFAVADVDLAFGMFKSTLPIKGLPIFKAAKASIQSFQFVGGDDIFSLGAEKIDFVLNYSTPWPGGIARPIIDFQKSFETEPGANDGAFMVPAGEEPVPLDFDGDSRVGVTVENGVIQLAQFVHLIGNFSFQKGPTTNVTLSTGFPGDITNLISLGADFIPDSIKDELNDILGLGDMGDLSKLENIEMEMLTVSASEVFGFVGINGPYWKDGNGSGRIDFNPDGTLAESEINEDAIGIVLQNFNFGFSMMQSTLAPFKALKALMPKHFAFQADIAEAAFVGVPGFEMSARDIQIRVNTGSAWGKVKALGTPVVNYLESFPGGYVNEDGEITPAGLNVGTENAPYYIDLDGNQRYAFSVGKGVVDIAGLLHISGSFGFEYGPTFTAIVNPGFPGDIVNFMEAFGELAADLLDAEIINDIVNLASELPLEMKSLTVAVKDAHVFLGYNGPYFEDTNGDGVIDENDEVNDNAVGLSVQGVDFGFGLFTSTLPLVRLLPLPKFIAIKAFVGDARLVGIPETTAVVQDVEIKFNYGSPWIRSFPPFGRPIIDFAKTFPGETSGSNGEEIPPGFEVLTGGEPIYLDFDGEFRVEASIGKAMLTISEAIHLSGSLAFVYGPAFMATVNTGLPSFISNILGDLADEFLAAMPDEVLNLVESLGLDPSFRTFLMDVSTFTLGGENLNAFIGMNGPYRPDSNGDLVIDENDPVNEDAVGMVADNVSFGMGIFDSTNPVFDVLGEVLQKLAEWIGRAIGAVGGGAGGAGAAGGTTGVAGAAPGAATGGSAGAAGGGTAGAAAWGVGAAAGAPAGGAAGATAGGAATGGAAGAGGAASGGSAGAKGGGTTGATIGRVLGQIAKLVAEAGRPRFVAGFLNADNVGLVGTGDYVELSADSIRLEFNLSSPPIFIPAGPFGVMTILPSLNFPLTFPADPDGDGPAEAGFDLKTGTNSSVKITASELTIKGTITNAVFRVAKTVHLSGSFAFELFDQKKLNINTNIPESIGTALNSIGLQEVADTIADFGGVTIGENFSTIEGLDYRGITFSGVNVNAFVGYGDPDFDKDLTEQDLYGFGLQDLNFGFGIFGAVLFPPLVHIAGYAEAKAVTTLGFGDFFTMSAENIVLGFNTGIPWLGTLYVPAIDFLSSFPVEEDDFDRLNDLPGMEILTGEDAFYLQFDGQERYLLGIGQIEISILDVIKLNGGMMFEFGPTHQVTVDTGLPAGLSDITGGLGDLLNAAAELGGASISSDLQTITGLDVRSLSFRAINMNGFIGYGDPDFNSETPLSEQDGLYGFGVQGVNIELASFISSIPGLPVFLSAQASIKNIALVGFDPIMSLSASDINLEVHTGTPWLGTLYTPTVDLAASFPAENQGIDVNGNGKSHPAGFEIKAVGDVDSAYLALDGGSRLKLSVADARMSLFSFVHMQGTFAFEMGTSHRVSIDTGVPASYANALGPLGLDSVVNILDSMDGVTVGENFSRIDGLEVNAMTMGASNVSVFVGIGDPDFDTAFADQDLLGFGMQNLDIGLGLFASRLPILGLPVFAALSAEVESFSTHGFGDIMTISANGLSLKVNASTGWFGEPVIGMPVIDFKSSFPAHTIDTGEGGLMDVPAGFELATGGDPVYLDYGPDSFIAVELEQGYIALADFIHFRGSFSFQYGGIHALTFNTGMGSNFGNLLGSLSRNDVINTLSGLLGANIAGDFSTISGLEFRSMTIGGSDISGFVGLGTPDFDAPLDSQDLIGFGLEDLDFGMAVFRNNLPPAAVLAGVLPPSQVAILDFLRLTLPTFVAMDVEVGSVGTYGFGDVFNISVEDVSLSVNMGTPLFATLTGNTLANLPSINFIESFGTEDRTGDGIPDLGFEVSTGGDPIFIGFTDLIVGLEIGYAEIELGGFASLYGSFAFELGATHDLNVKLGKTGASAETHEMASYIFRATDVFGFVGIGGYYQDTDGDGRITADDSVNESALGFFIDDMHFGLALFQPTSPILGLAGLAPDPVFFALDLKADSVGFSGGQGLLEMNAYNLNLRMNMSTVTVPGLTPYIDFAASEGLEAEPAGKDLDNDGKFGEPRGFEVKTGGDSIYLDFDSFLIEASIDYAEATIGGAIQLTGGFTFAKGPKETVQLTNGDVVEIETVTLGAANINAFMGFNGPYRSDTNGDLLINEFDQINTSAVGLVMNNVDIGILMGSPTNLFDLRQFLSAKATVESIGLVGVPGITAEASNLEIAVNLSAGIVLDLEVIDFLASFPDQDWTGDSVVDGDGFAVPAGADSVILDFNSLLIKAFGSVRIGVETGGESWFGINGDLDFELSSNHLQAFVNGQLFIGPESSPFVSLSTTGLFIVNGDGAAMKLDASLDLGLGADVGINLNADFSVTFNTSSQNISYVIPDGFISVPDESTDGAGNRILVIPGAPPMKGGSATPYLMIQAFGMLEILNSFKLHGNFGFLVTGNGNLEVTIDAAIDIIGNTLKVDGGAGIYFGDDAGFAAAMSLTVSSGAFAGVGFELGGIYTLKVNTSPLNRTFGFNTVAARSAEILFAGQLSLINLVNINGYLSIKVDGVGFSFDVNGSVEIKPLGTLNASGSLDISAAGIVGSLQLGATSGASLGFGVVNFEGRFQIAINTTTSTQPIRVLNVHSGSGAVAGFRNENVAAQTIIVSFGGAIGVGPFTMDGAATIELGASTLAVDVRATLDMLGFGKLSVNGNAVIGVASPYFAANIGLGANVLSIAGFQLSANFTLELDTRTSTYKVDLVGSVSAWIFEMNVNASITYSGNILRFDFTSSLGWGPFNFSVFGYAQSDGQFSITMQAGVNESVNLGLIRASFHFDVTLTVSNSGIFGSLSAGGSVEVYIPIWGWEGISASIGGSVDVNINTGQVKISVALGSSSVSREVQDEDANGNKLFVDDLSKPIFDEFGDLIGYEQMPKMVTKSAGTDGEELFSFTIGGQAPPALASVSGGVLTLNTSYSNHYTLRTSGSTVHVGAIGLDQTYSGVNKIFASFGNGNDFISITGTGTMPVEIHVSGGNNTILVNISGDALIYGGPGNDTIVTGAGNDIVHAGGGNNSISTNAGNDIIYGGDGNDSINAGSGDDIIYVGSGNNVLNGGSGNDTYIFTGDFGNNFIVETDSTTDVDTIDLSAVTANITFDLGASGRNVVTAGSNSIIDSDQRIEVFVGGSGNDTFNVTATNNNDITLRGNSGDDTYNILLGALAGDVIIDDQVNNTDYDVLNVSTPLAATLTVSHTAGDSKISQSGNVVRYAHDYHNVAAININALIADVQITGNGGIGAKKIDLEKEFTIQSKFLTWDGYVNAGLIDFQTEEGITIHHDLIARNNGPVTLNVAKGDIKLHEGIYSSAGSTRVGDGSGDITLIAQKGSVLTDAKGWLRDDGTFEAGSFPLNLDWALRNSRFNAGSINSDTLEITIAGAQSFEETLFLANGTTIRQGNGALIASRNGSLNISAFNQIGHDTVGAFHVSPLSIFTNVRSVTLNSTNLQNAALIELDDIVVGGDSSIGKLDLISLLGRAEVHIPVNAFDKPVFFSGNQLEILNTVTTSDNIFIATTDKRLPIVIVPNLAWIGNNPEANSGMILDQNEMDRLLTPRTVFIGAEELTNHLVLGDGNGTAIKFSAPSVFLRGDTIHVRNDISAKNLVFFGDGNTVTLSANITDSESISFNDTVEVDGTRVVQSDGQITFGAPGLKAKGNGGGDDDLTLNAGGAIVSTLAFGDSIKPLRDLTLNSSSSINMTSVDITRDLRITGGTSVTFNGNVNIGGNLIVSDVDQLNFNGDLNVAGTITIVTTNGSMTFSGDVTSGGFVELTAPVTQNINFGRTLTVNNGNSDVTIHQVNNLNFDDDVVVRNFTQIAGNGSTTFRRELIANKDVSINTTDQIRFRDELTVADNVVLNAQRISLEDTVLVGDDFTVIIVGNIPATDYIIDFNDSLTVGGNLTLTGLDRVTVDRDAQIGGRVDIETVSGGINFKRSLTSGKNITLETSNTADIAIGETLSVESGNSDFHIVKTRNSTFSGSVNVRNLTVSNASGTATFSQQITANDIYIKSAIGIIMANTVTITGNMTLFSNQINFGSNTGSINGTTGSVLTLAPYSPSAATSIDIGSPVSNSGTLDISDQDIRAMATNWDRVVIGHLNTGMGTVRVGTLLVSQTSSLRNTFQIHGGSVVVEEEIEFATTGVDYLLLKANDPFGNGVTVNAVIGRESTVRTDWIRIESQADVVVNAPVYANNRISIAAGFDADGDSLNDFGNIVVNGYGSNTGLLATTNTVANGIIELVTGSQAGNMIFWDTTISAAGGDSAIKLYSPAGSIDGLNELSTLSANSLAVDAEGSIALNTEVSEIRQVSINSRNNIAAIDSNVFFGAADKSLEGLKSANGNISLVNKGSLTIRSASGGVVAGNGNISISLTGATSDLTINDALMAASIVELTAPRNILQNSDITSATGPVDLTADTGSITMQDGVTTTAVDGSATGDVTLIAGTNIALSVIHADGTVDLTATSGKITDNLSTEDLNILGGSTKLIMTAGTGIGGPGDADLDTLVASLTAKTTVSGGIHIDERNGLLIAGSVTTAGNGPILISLQDGNLTVNNPVSANGSGNILLEALDGSMVISAALSSATGHITLFAKNNMTLAAGVSVSTATAGTISMVAETGDLSMNGSATVTATDSSIRIQAEGDIHLGNINAGNLGRVSIVSQSHSIFNATGSTLNVSAKDLRMEADRAIGTALNPLTLAVDNLAASAKSNHISSKGIYLAQIGDLVITEIAPVEVQLVDADNEQTELADSTPLADLRTGDNGSIVLRAEGSITLNDGNENGGAVVANQSGNILIRATGATADLTINGNVLSTTGHITLYAEGSIAQNANVTTGAPGTVYISAEEGHFTMDADAVVTATNSSIIARTGGDATLGLLTASHVSSRSYEGSIFSADGTSMNATATDLRLQAGKAIGTADAPILTTVDHLTAHAKSNSADEKGLYLNNATSVIVRDVEVTVQQVLTDATTAEVTETSQSDLVTGNDGDIALTTVDGTITLTDANASESAINAVGSGEVILVANGNDRDIIAQNNADILGGTGDITLTANRNIVLAAANVDVVTAGDAEISLTATNGYILMTDGSTIVNEDGDIDLHALTHIDVSQIQSTTGDLFLHAETGTIRDNTALEEANLVTGGTAHLKAATGIGANATQEQDLNTSVAGLTALNTGSGDIIIQEETGFTLTNDEELTLGGVVNNAIGGDIRILTLANRIGVDGEVRTAAANTGTDYGHIALRGMAVGTELIVNAAITATNGHITLRANDRIEFSAPVSADQIGTILVVAPSATAEILVHNDAVDTFGALVTENQNIIVESGNNAQITGIHAGTATVEVAVVNGAITSGGHENLRDIVAQNLRLRAQAGIGNAADPMRIDVSTIAAYTVEGPIQITNLGSLTIDTVAVVGVMDVLYASGLTSYGSMAPGSDQPISDIRADGDILILSETGSITINDGVNDNGIGIQSQGGSIVVEAATFIDQNADILTNETGTISVEAKDGNVTMLDGTTTQTVTGTITYTAAGDIFLSLLESTAGGNVTVDSGDRIRDNTLLEEPNIRTTGLATLLAVNGIGDVGVEDINLDVGSVTATNTTSGRMVLREVDTLEIAPTGLTTQGGNGDIIVTVNAGNLTVNGPITAHGSGNILFETLALDADITVNASILSDSGNISIIAGQDVTFATTANVVIAGAPGTIDVEAVTGSIDQLSTLALQTDGSNIMLKSAIDVKIGVIDARLNSDRADNTLDDQSSWGNIAITATAGSILDNKDRAETAINLYANGARLEAKTSIGIVGEDTDNAIETELSTMSAVTTAGGIGSSIHIVESTDIAVDTVSTFSTHRVAGDATTSDTTVESLSDLVTAGNGNIILQTLSGNITLNEGVGGIADAAVSANGSGNVLIEALDLSTDITVNARILSDSGNISIIAGRDVSFATTGNVVIANAPGTIDVEAVTGSIDQLS